MNADKKGKPYVSPSSELLGLSVTDVLTGSSDTPGEDKDENQGVWVS